MKNAFNSLLTLLILVTFLFLSSCEEAFFEEVPDDNPVSIFEQAWTFADQEYTFFEFKKIDWDSVYQEFKPRVNNDISEEDLFSVIADMLFLLRDGHVNLKSKFDRSRNWEWYLGFPENFNYPLLERNYFKSNEQFVGALVVYDFGDVGYVRYSSFSNGVSNDNLDYIIQKFKDHKGIIFDVRNNGGGFLSNANKIAKRFASEKLQVALQYYKNGPNHDDLDGPFSISVTPPEDLPTYDGSVVVLTNRHSFSATTFFTQYMRELPNVTTLGDWTGGGGGAPSFTELTNGWELRVSSTLTTDPQGFNIEDGIPPDVKVDMNKVDEDAGKDTILEEALKILRK